jgi:hypothetical protein
MDNNATRCIAEIHKDGHSVVMAAMRTAGRLLHSAVGKAGPWIGIPGKATRDSEAAIHDIPEACYRRCSPRAVQLTLAA